MDDPRCEHGVPLAMACWDCPVSSYRKDGPIATCCGHRKDLHRRGGCDAMVTFGNPPQGAGRCACRWSPEADQ